MMLGSSPIFRFRAPPPSDGPLPPAQVAEGGSTDTIMDESSIAIIHPPPVIQTIVDKTARFVANNGPEFEKRIIITNAGNAKFDFLTVSDPYHAYYQYRLSEARAQLFGEWQKSQEQARQKARQIAEDEIEHWHDFVVVESIDFADDEDDDLPPPMTLAGVQPEEGVEAGGNEDDEEVQLVEEMAEISPNPKSATVAHLPEELIAEILLRLPVRPLMRFKCVSKQWLSMISSRQFAKYHLSTSVKNSNTAQLLFKSPISGIKQCSLYSVLYEPSAHVSDIVYPSQAQQPNSFLKIVGVVNGLVCLFLGDCWGERRLYVWNPVLRKSKLLPGSNSSLEGYSFDTYGFGYDELNDDYKVVEVLCVVTAGVYEAKLKIYSLRADSWRKIEELKGGFLNCAKGKYAIGKIFWIFNQIDTLSRKEKEKKIVCLDMASDKYEEVKGPYNGCDIVGKWAMGVLNGRPCLLSDDYSTSSDLWIMDKFGVEESWSKVISFPYVNGFPYCENSVLCMSRNGEFVFIDESGLLVCSSKDKKFQLIRVGGFSSISDVFLYVESMVPLCNN